MSLATLNWKRVGGVTPASNSIPNVLNAIYSAGTATTYWDGSARTQGSGSAWTWSRFQATGTTEAVYASPVTGALNHRAIFAGAAGAKTPTMASPDTYSASVVMAGLAKNAGSFNAWDNAAPFTSGQFYGFWKCLNLASFTISKVHIIESQEAIVIVFEATTGVCQSVLIGAYLDPETATGTAAESDGRRYGLAVPYSSVATTATFLETNASWLSHSTSANQYHHMVADIGAVSTFVTVNKLQLFQAGTAATVTATSMSNAASEVVIMPIAFGANSAAPNDVFLGVSRQFGAARNVVSMTTRQLASVDVHHNVGSSTSAAGNTLGFKV